MCAIEFRLMIGSGHKRWITLFKCLYRDSADASKGGVCSAFPKYWGRGAISLSHISILNLKLNHEYDVKVQTVPFKLDINCIHIYMIHVWIASFLHIACPPFKGTESFRTICFLRCFVVSQKTFSICCPNYLRTNTVNDMHINAPFKFQE